MKLTIEGTPEEIRSFLNPVQPVVKTTFIPEQGISKPAEPYCAVADAVSDEKKEEPP